MFYYVNIYNVLLGYLKLWFYLCMIGRNIYVIFNMWISF